MTVGAGEAEGGTVDDLSADDAFGILQ